MAPGYEPGNQAVRRARERGGLPAVALAGALMGLREVLEGPPKDPAPVVVQANSDPVDLEADGVHLVVEGASVEAPPLPPYALRPTSGRRRARRRG